MSRPASPLPPGVLSDRERAVAEKFAAGMTYREIGEVLFIAPSTVRTHIGSIYEKLGVRNKVGLAGRLASEPEAEAQQPVGTGASLPVIAMFPIESLSAEERWLRFADGLSSDIIVDLARHSGLPVIAFHTVKALAASGTVSANAARLGATYIISGQLRADSERLRVTVQLSEARSGISLWSERYDRTIADVFVLQDSLTQAIVNTLAGCAGTLATYGRKAARRKAPASLEAYDYFLLGNEMHNLFTPHGHAEAVRLLSRALELDPMLAPAWTELGYCYSIAACNGFDDDLAGALRKWRDAVESALRIDPSDSVALQCLGDAMAAAGDLEGAARSFERALQFGANDADTLALLAGSKALVQGDTDAAVAMIGRALQLNPLPAKWYFGMEGRALFAAGRYRESLAPFYRSVPDSAGTLMFLALAHAAVGDAADAAAMAERLAGECPGFTVERFIAGYPVTSEAARTKMREAAKSAGLA